MKKLGDLLMGRLWLIISGMAVVSVPSIVLGQPTTPGPARVASVSAVAHFNISGALGEGLASQAIVQRVVAAGKSLYFLVSPGPSARSSVLVRTDPRGNIDQVTPLGSDETTDFAVAASGRMFVRSLSPLSASNEILRVLGTDGKPVAQPKRVIAMGMLTAVDDSLISVSPRGTVSHLAGKRAGASFSVPRLGRPDFVLGLSSHGLVIVDRYAAELQWIDVDQQTARTIPLSLPEVEDARAAYQKIGVPAGAEAILVQTVTKDESGNTYVMFSGFNRLLGIPVAVFDASGELLIRLRVETIKTTGGKWLIPAAMAAVAGNLYVADARGEVVVYPIPSVAR